MAKEINKSSIRQEQTVIDSSDDNCLHLHSHNFNVIEYINTKFKHSSLYEINDELVNLSKSIAKTQYESKNLVTNHFNKFIECHNMMRRIMQDMNKNEMHKEITRRAENTLKKMEEKLCDIVGDVACDIDKRAFDERREHYIQKYKCIFDLKRQLEINLNSFEKFVKLVGEARNEFKQVQNSKFMCKKMEETANVQSRYLENLFEVIRNENTSFEQACYFFELYFEITGEKGLEKVESTLLVNYKEATHGNKEMGYEYVEYLFISLKRLVSHLRNVRIINEGINHFFQCLRGVIKGKRLGYIKIIMKRVENCRKEMVLKKESKVYFDKQLIDMKVEGFREATQNKTLEEVAVMYGQYIDSMSKMEKKEMENVERNNAEGLIIQEKERLREIIYDYIIGFATAMKTREYEYLKCEGNEIQNAQKCLGSSESQLKKKLKGFLKKCREEVIQNIAHTLEKTIEQNNDIKSLIEVLRIIDKTPEFYKDILFEAHKQIFKRPVVCFFIYKLANCRKPILTKEEYEITERLNYQFGFLLKLK